MNIFLITFCLPLLTYLKFDCCYCNNPVIDRTDISFRCRPLILCSLVCIINDGQQEKVITQRLAIAGYSIDLCSQTKMDLIT